MKILKYLLFILPFFLAPNVFAQTTDVSNKIRYSPDTSGGTYYGDEIFLGGYNGQFSVNTRYNGQLSQIEFYLKDSDYSFELNKTYTITLNMATSDWRNNFMGPLVYGSNSDGSITSGSPNWYVLNTFSFVSMKKIKFNIKPTGTIKPLTKFTIYSTNVTSTAFTGVNNWNLSSIIIDDNSSSSSSTTPTPTPTSNPTFDDTGIINNANENTQDIINNSDKNTSDIIENNNQNTQIIDSSLNSQCKNGPIILSDEYFMKDNYYLDENGNEVADSSAAISTYFVIKPNSLYTISSPGGLAGNSYSICLYDSNKNILAANSSRKCQSVNQYTNGIDSGPYAQYMRITIPKRWYANLAITGPICNNFTKESIDNASSAIGGAIQGGASGIIDNQNANTDKEIDSQKVCSFIYNTNIITHNKILISNGTEQNNNTNGITDYIKLYDSTLKVVKNVNYNTGAYSCFYDMNKILISCFNNKTELNEIINIPNNASYVRFTIRQDTNVPNFQICKNGNQALSDSINDVNDSINNPNVDSGTGEGFFDNFTSQDFGLSQIITIPLNTIQSLTSKTCVPLSVPIPFTNSNVNLPCMTEIYENKFPSIYNLWKVVSFGIVAYLIAIDIFHIVKGFKDPESDKVEVLDL